MTKKDLREVKEIIFKEYLENRTALSIISDMVGLSRGSIMYHVGQFKTTQVNYLRQKYSKEFLEDFIRDKTYLEASKVLNISFGTFRSLLSYHAVKRDSDYFIKNVVNKEFYTDRKFEKEFYYFAGLFATDGGFHGKNTMRINIKNKGAKELLTKLSNFMGHNNIREYKNSYYESSFTSVGLKKRLLEIGIPEHNKTYLIRDVYIPNKECLYSFLCGSLDGDGTIACSKSPYGYYTSLRFNLCSYSYEYLLNISSKIKDLAGFDSVIDINKSMSNLRIGRTLNVDKFLQEMYSVTPFKLSCKYQKYLNVINKVMI